VTSAPEAGSTGLTLSGDPEPAPSPYRWAWYLPGLVAVGWGFYGLLTAPMGPDPLQWVLFTALGVAGHDLVLVPVAVGVGLLVARILPKVLRAPAQVGLIGTGIALVAGFAYILGPGVSADVPSALPFNYAGRVAVLLAVLWVAMAGWAVLRIVRARSRSPSRSRSGSRRAGDADQPE